jgi:vitamin B12 transporter
MNTRRRVVLSVFLVTFAPFALSAEDEDMETIVVSASRTPVPLDAVGSSVTVIGPEQIEMRSPVFVHELLQTVPGADISRSGGLGANAQIRVRGAEANQTLVMIDGIEANDLSLGSEFDFAHLTVDGVERIEVLRGAQSSLWGSDALSGVVNIVTRRGEGPWRVQGFGSGGSFGTAEGGGGISGGTDRYHLALHGRYFDSGGTNVALSGSERDAYGNTTLSLRAGYSPIEVLDFDIVLRHSDVTKEFDDTPFPAFVPADSDRGTQSDQTYGRAQASLSLFEGRWEHRLGGAVTTTDNDNFAGGVEDSSTQGKKYRVDYQTSVRFSTPQFASAEHTLTFAWEREREEFTQRGAPSFFGDPNQDQEIDSTGYVGEYLIGLWDQLYLSGAVRHDDNDDFGDATTYRATGAWVSPTRATKVHVSWGTGAKNPTFTERFGFTPDTFFGNPDVQPEESEGWEVGVEQPFLDEQLRLGVTYFDEQLDNEINGFFFDPGIPPFGGFTAVNLDGRSERNGVEAYFETGIWQGLDASGAYTYTDATEPDAAGRQIREVRRPKHVASFNVGYRFYGERARINFHLDYTGRQNDFDFSTFPATIVRLDDYALVDVAAGFRVTEYLEIFARIENLLDEEYQEVFGFATPGIAAYGGVRVTFDASRGFGALRSAR